MGINRGRLAQLNVFGLGFRDLQLGFELLRIDFNLFIGALAPRVLEAGADADAVALRHTLEDAWADARVNRRWQHFIVQISADETETLLLRATSMWMPAPSRGRKSLQRATAGSPPKKSSQTMGASVA